MKVVIFGEVVTFVKMKDEIFTIIQIADPRFPNIKGTNEIVIRGGVECPLGTNVKVTITDESVM